MITQVLFAILLLTLFTFSLAFAVVVARLLGLEDDPLSDL